MVVGDRRNSESIRRRASVVAGAFVVLAAACSSELAAPADPSPTVSDAPAVTAGHTSQAPLFDRPATATRPIVSGGGHFPIAALREIPDGLATGVSDAVQIGGDRIWLPWPPYASPHPDGSVVVTGAQSELLVDMQAGFEHVVSQRAAWDAMPPYLASAQVAFAQGSRVARRRAGSESAWELVVDTAGLPYETRLAANRSAAYDHVSLCPPHPTSETLGVDTGDSASERDRAGAAIEAFITGMRSPGGRPMHSWGTTVNDVAKLLVYSPGEPMELALGGHSLTGIGYFPGDWSAEAKQWLTRRAAQGAVSDSLVGHAVVSTGPDTLWEACSDLATIIPGVYTESHRTRQVESLWARGLRLEFTSPAVERAWVADLSVAGHALAVVCHQPGQSFLVDASTGDHLDAGTDHPAQVEAMWLTWSRLSYRVLRNALFDGDCDGEAFMEALRWLQQAKDDHAAGIDWSEPRAWASGVRDQWVAARQWVVVPQIEAWRAHRDHRWHLEFWCHVGIPIGALVEGELQRPSLKYRCTMAQWAALSQAAADAPPVTSELSATQWDPGASWYERMYLSPFKPLESILGCLPDEAAIEESLEQHADLPVERPPKKPWQPGSLPSTPPDRSYPRIMPPCPQALWPPQSDRFWWPHSEPLAELPAVVAP